MPLGAVLLALALGAYFYMNAQPGEPPLSAKASFVARLGPIVSSTVGPLGWVLPQTIAVIVAWAAMESRWGSSELTAQANNLFGIKAGPTWQKEGKPFIRIITHEHQGQPGYPPEGETVEADFRKYGSWGESVADFVNLLKITDAYKPIFDKLALGDVAGALRAADASGYSTASNYAARISGALNTLGSIVS